MCNLAGLALIRAGMGIFIILQVVFLSNDEINDT